MKKKILIIGAGPSGLSTALELTKNADYELIIIEKGTQIGGLSRTIEYNNIKFDIGPHRISAQLPLVLNTLKELLKHNLLEKANTHGVYFDNFLYNYPPKISDLLRFSTLKRTLVFGNDWLYTIIFNFFSPNKKSSSFKTQLLNNFGKSFCKKVIFPMIEKVWGTDDLHSDFARIRFEKPSFFSIFKKLFFNKKINDSKFYYPLKGFSQIWDEMELILKKNNCKIEKGAIIESINATSLKGPYQVEYILNNGEKASINTDLIISTISNKYLITYLEKTNLVNNIITTKPSFVSRTLRLGIFEVKNFHIPTRVIIFPEKKYIFNRISEMNLFSDLGYKQNNAILMIDVICDNNSETCLLPDEEFICLLKKSVLQLNWFKEKDIKQCFSVKFEDAYPVLSKNRYEAQENIEKFFKDSNIILCGREASSDYNNAHNAIEKGFLTAKFIKNEISENEYRELTQKIGRLPIQD